VQPPIIIAEGRDVTVYRTVADAALSLEGPDVLGDIYQAYDANGVSLKLISNGGPDDYSAKVSILASDPPVHDADGLRRLLRENLEHDRASVSTSASLDNLLEAFIALNGFSR
jgi:hypothetical protein